MNADVVIIGAGPAGIFTALEMIKKGSKQKIIMVEKGQAVETAIAPRTRRKSASTASPIATLPPASPVPVRFLTASCPSAMR